MLLLRTHTVTRNRPEPVEDDHGWTLPTAGTVPPVDYDGNLQLGIPESYVTASTDGDSGPFSPRIVQAGTVYLDETADVVPGDVLTIDTVDYQVRSARPMPDPVGGGAGSLVAEVSTDGVLLDE